MNAKLPSSEAPDFCPMTDSVAKPVPSDRTCSMPTLVKALNKLRKSERSLCIDSLSSGVSRCSVTRRISPDKRHSPGLI